MYAIQVLRLTGEQLGHAPEYMAERIYNEVHDGYIATAVLLDITGGSPDKTDPRSKHRCLFHRQRSRRCRVARYI